MAGAIMDKVWGLFGGVGQEAEDYENDSGNRMRCGGD